MTTKVSDLFTLRYGHSLELNRLKQSASADAVNFVSRTTKNNGVSARVERIANLAPAAAGTITVALSGQGGAGEAFVQPFPYYCGFHIMILASIIEMTEQEKLWWATCITANRFRFGFGRQVNRTLKDLRLPPPESIPDYVALGDVNRFYGAEAPVTDTAVPLSAPTDWAKFALRELFDIRKGKRLTKADMKPGPIPFIGAIEKNNGVSGFVITALHKGKTITVNYNGSVAEAFYQPEEFWCSDDVNVLYPKSSLSPGVAMFICTLIRREKYRFNYGRKWHLERMREATISLPIDAAGKPDRNYMEAFIRSLPYSSILKI